MKEITELEFMERHLDDAVEESYEKLCKKVIGTLKAYEELFDITFRYYGSLDEFEQAKKEFLDTDFWGDDSETND